MNRLPLALGALLTLTAADLPKKSEPPLTALTKRSGGERPAEQRALRFDVADLASSGVLDELELGQDIIVRRALAHAGVL